MPLLVGMSLTVEPHDGRELERLVTAMLNVSGLIKRLVDEAVADGATGVSAIDRVAEQMLTALASVAEHTTDMDLQIATVITGSSAVCLARALGVADLMRGEL